MAEKPFSELPPAERHRARAGPRAHWGASGAPAEPRTGRALTRGIDAAQEGLHVLVTLGLISVAVGVGAAAPTVPPSACLGSLLPLPVLCSWGGRDGDGHTALPAPTGLPRSSCRGCRGEGLWLGPQRAAACPCLLSCPSSSRASAEGAELAKNQDVPHPPCLEAVGAEFLPHR